MNDKAELPAGTYLAPLEAAEPADIERLLDLAFGGDRRLRTAYRLREGTACERTASMAAFNTSGVLVGSLQTWPLALTAPDGRFTPLWLIGPVAVDPARRGEGIARAMLATALDTLDGTGISAILIGDPAYYEPFGFNSEATGSWDLPGPVERHRLLARIAAGETLPAEGKLEPRR